MAISLAGAYLLGSLGAGAMGSASSYLSNQQAWKKQKKMFAWQKAWEKEKMQNSYQWAVDDMQKAGLNPALGYTQGGATGSGAPSPTAPNMGFDNPLSSMASALELHNSARMTDANILKTTSEVGNIDSQTALNIANTEIVKKYGSEKAKSEIANNLANVGVKASQSAKNVEEVNLIKGGTTAKTLGTAITNEVGKAVKKLKHNNYKIDLGV